MLRLSKSALKAFRSTPIIPRQFNTFSPDFTETCLAPKLGRTEIINSAELTARTRNGVLGAFNVASESNQQVVKTEHLMKALLQQKDGLARRIFANAGLDNTTLFRSTDKFISQQPKKVTGSGQPVVGFHFNSLLDNARKFQKEMGDSLLSVEHLVLALSLDKRFRQDLFKNLHISDKELKDAIQAVRGSQRVTDNNPETKHEALDKYGNDLTELARRGKLDPVIGRDKEISQCIQILSRRTKSNPVITGEPGVGKTAIAEGLAQRIIRGDVPEPLLNRKLISMNIGSLLAGAKNGGDIEERLEDVVKEVNSSNGQVILFIDEINNVVGAAGGATNVSNLLKPILGRGELRCIGATTPNEYEKYIEKDPALERIFQQVLCVQPSVKDTISILRVLRGRYELHHGVKISHSALSSAAILSDRHIKKRFLPDKAIDVVDEAAAKLKMEITSKCTDLDIIDRDVLKLEMEKLKLSLKDDPDKASKERLIKLEHELGVLKLKQQELNDQWNAEKVLMNKIWSIKEEIDRVNLEMEAAEREYNLNSAAELKYGTLIPLQLQLDEAETSLADYQKSGKSLMRQEVMDHDITKIVSNLTGIPDLKRH